MKKQSQAASGVENTSYYQETLRMFQEWDETGIMPEELKKDVEEMMSLLPPE